jgi:hypothetical protein
MEVRPRGERPLAPAIGRWSAVRAGGKILALALRAWRPLLLVVRALAVRRTRSPLLLVPRTLALGTRTLPRQVQLPSAGVLGRLTPLPGAVAWPGTAWLIRPLGPAAPSRAAVEWRPTGTAMPCVTRWFHCAPYRRAAGRCTAVAGAGGARSGAFPLETPPRAEPWLCASSVPLARGARQADFEAHPSRRIRCPQRRPTPTSW